MSVLRILEGGEWRDYGASSLPMAIGVSSQGLLVFGNMAEADPAAWLELTDKGMFLQPVRGPVSTRCNGNEVVDSTWLRAGDEVQIGEARLTVGADAGVVLLSSVPKRIVPVLTLPSGPPPPTDPPRDSNPLPGDQAPTPAEPPESEHSGTHTEVDTPAPSSPGEERTDPEEIISPPLGAQTPSEGSASVVPEQSHKQPSIAEDFVRLPEARGRSRLRQAVVLVFVLLFVGVTLVLVAVPVELVIVPAPDTIEIGGFLPTLKIKDRYLALPGSYEVVATKKGYHPLRETLVVEFGSEPKLPYDLQKLPGLLAVVSQPVNGATVRIEGRVVGETPFSSLELEAGYYELEIVAERYLPARETIEIEGMGNEQSIRVTLQPGWGTLQVASDPPGAEVWLDEASVGQTPTLTEPLGGSYQLVLKKDGWKTIHQQVRIEPGESLSLPEFRLQRLDGFLEVTSIPPGAQVMIDGEFRGVTPLTQPVVSGSEHQIGLSKSGFEGESRSVRVQGGETKSIHVQMETEYGTVFFFSHPSDTKLTVDGEELEDWTARRLRLSTVPHRITITKDGYEPHSETVTPTAEVAKTINAQLRPQRQVIAEIGQPDSKTAAGQILTRITIREPVRSQLGASRREAGRRSNEGLYIVELTRTFEISQKEVTNSEFQQFRKEHNSGTLDGFDLNEPSQPVTSVTWDDAAAYLNWLSRQDGLSPAYENRNGTMVPVVPTTLGYRLPTEAEWAFVARYDGGTRKTPKRFPWGDEPSPPRHSGNYADSNAVNAVPVTIEDYDDGYRVAAPVGNYPADSSGLHDLGGNVSEWCHDYYDDRVGNETTPLRDPTGPTRGTSHVVRGASWRHGRVTELRLSYRNYSSTSHDDLGFRIARYAEEPSQE